MKILGYILLTLFLILAIGYCTVMNMLSKTTLGGWTPPPETEYTEEKVESETEKLKADDAVKKLQSTHSFDDDHRAHPTSFSVKIENLDTDTTRYYYLKTVYQNPNNEELTISNYRVDSKSGMIEKKDLKSNSWIYLNE
jgi:hypothetical protein